MEMELYRDSAQVDSGLVTSTMQFAPARMTGPGRSLRLASERQAVTKVKKFPRIQISGFRLQNGRSG